LFLVGRWDKALQMAYEIKEKFRKWTGYNPKLSISGGMEIVGGKFPILKAADLAGEAEAKAKKHEISTANLQKNSFTLFNKPLNWENEFNIVAGLKEEFMKYVSDGGGTKDKLPRGLLMLIQKFYLLYQEQTKKCKNPSWQWLLLYYLKRMGERTRPILKEYIDQFMKDILANTHKGDKYLSDYKYLELAAIAARWAELEKRTKDKKELKHYENII